MAAEVSKPDFSYQWSSGGAIVAPSNLKIQTGWTAEVPPFQWENWLQNRQDNAILHLFQKGISEWDASSNYYFTTGGVRSYVQGSNGSIYVAVADSIGQNPITDTLNTYWKLAFTATAATTTTPGIMRFGTAPEQLSGILTTVASNPAGVMSLITSLFPKRTFGASDSIRIPDVPGGLIIQWGRSSSSSSGNATASLSVIFPNSFILGVPVDSGFNSSGTTYGSWDAQLSTSSTIVTRWSAVPSDYAYLAIGF